MRKRLLSMLTLGATIAVAAVGIAAAEKPTVVREGNLILKLNGGTNPKSLPKNKPAPIALDFDGEISTVDGSQPPAAKKITIDFDKHSAVNAKGLPTCRSGQLQTQDTQHAKAACRAAIVGQGTMTVRVALPEQPPFNSKGPLVLFNGGIKGGVTTMFIHAYVDVPAPTAIVTPVTIEKIHKGPYGTRAIAKVPVIVGGSGSVTSFDLTIHRAFKSHGKKQSYLLAECANGRIVAHASAVFRDSSRISGGVVRACKVRR